MPSHVGYESLMHSHDKSVVLKLSGVCEASAVYKFYHLGNDEQGYFITLWLLRNLNSV